MEIRLASCIGFCSGVKRAIRLAESELNKKRKIYSVGPIIHNPRVVENLAKQGLETVKDLDAISKGLFLIRSHGVGPEVIKAARLKNLEVVDATCPFVKKSQEAVESLSKEGYKILIVGQSAHPEIKGLVGYAGDKARVVSSVEEAESLELKNLRVSVIAQTTYSESKYKDIVSVLVKKECRELRVFNTICHETLKRQEAARELAFDADLMLVIGGRNSANTARLVEIANKLGKEVYHIEGAKELDPRWLLNKKNVGISSGASTPDWIIKEVVEKLDLLCQRRSDPKGISAAANSNKEVVI